MDIYLIHYFFLPKNGINNGKFAATMFNFFETNNNIVLEIAVVTIVSSLIIAVSLGVSQILRQSNFFGHYLFGAPSLPKADLKEAGTNK